MLVCVHLFSDGGNSNFLFAWDWNTARVRCLEADGGLPHELWRWGLLLVSEARKCPVVSAPQSSLEQSGPPPVQEAIKRHSAFFNRWSWSIRKHFAFLLLYSSLAFFFKRGFASFSYWYFVFHYVAWHDGFWFVVFVNYLFAFCVIEYFEKSSHFFKLTCF